MKLSQAFDLWPFPQGDPRRVHPLQNDPFIDREVEVFYCSNVPIPNDPEDRLASSMAVALSEKAVVVVRADFTYVNPDWYDVIKHSVQVYPLAYLVRVDRVYRTRMTNGTATERDVTLIFTRDSTLEPFTLPAPDSRFRSAFDDFCSALLRLN